MYFFKIILLCLALQCQPAWPQRGSRFMQGQVTSDTPAAGPDYSNLVYWASHPQKDDRADSIPSFLQSEDRDTSADVFFIHPTTFTKGLMANEWNADIDDTGLNELTDNKTILLQASIFNGSCRIFAPRYRQAHLKSFFLKNSPQAPTALDIAYHDVKTAFKYYLTHYNHGRPIIIAGHSQGAYHAIHLLKDFFDGKPLTKQLVCAYIAGWPIRKDEFSALPFGTNALQTGCVLGWRSYRSGTKDVLVEKEGGNSLCINPITWDTSSVPSDKALHKGMVGKKFNEVYAHTISAAVAPGAHILWVDVPPELDDSKGFLNNFHIADFNLFYMDVRANVKQRVQAFLDK